MASRPSDLQRRRYQGLKRGDRLIVATANSLSLQGALRLCTLALALLELIPGNHRFYHNST
jgi:hypothetical protein